MSALERELTRRFGRAWIVVFFGILAAALVLAIIAQHYVEHASWKSIATGAISAAIFALLVQVFWRALQRTKPS